MEGRKETLTQYLPQRRVRQSVVRAVLWTAWANRLWHLIYYPEHTGTEVQWHWRRPHCSAGHQHLSPTHIHNQDLFTTEPEYFKCGLTHNLNDQNRSFVVFYPEKETMPSPVSGFSLWKRWCAGLKKLPSQRHKVQRVHFKYKPVSNTYNSLITWHILPLYQS